MMILTFKIFAVCILLCECCDYFSMFAVVDALIIISNNHHHHHNFLKRLSFSSYSSNTKILLTPLKNNNNFLAQNDYLNNLRDKHNDAIIKKKKIIKQYQFPANGFNAKEIIMSSLLQEDEDLGIGNKSNVSDDDYSDETKQQIKKAWKRNPMSNVNITLPVALLLLNPTEYPTLSPARREIRKGSILIAPSSYNQNATIIKRGKGDDRTHPFDIIAKQVYMSENKNSCDGMLNQNPNIPIIVQYQDNHITVINKPAGAPAIPSRKDGHRRQTVQAALPFLLKPPQSFPTELLYPHNCHRLDMPTSGLLVCAKTKPALVSMSHLFESHAADRTYVATINGVLESNLCIPLTSYEAKRLDMQIDDDDNNHAWNIIATELDNKPCITLWRAMQTSESNNIARNNTFAKIEIILKTGRYHQIRRHMP